MNQKSYDDNPKLYLIPTPIGNMGDITIRSINILKDVSFIFAEDTRVTGLLLNNLEIKKKLISNHKYNEKSNYEKLKKTYNEKLDIALVSDRGTPGISDPGELIIKKAIEIGYNVICLPGATAFVPALIMSGLDCGKFYFYGFLNSNKKQRIDELKRLVNFKDTLIFYESPHRIEETLNDLYSVLGKRKISICREISKKYEEIYRFNLGDKIDIIIKGEFVIVIEGNKDTDDYLDISIKDHVQLYLNSNHSLMDCIKLVAKDRNMKKNEVYKIYHE